ncbi:MAG: cytochrome P450 [Polyangiaceae bacterium]
MHVRSVRESPGAVMRRPPGPRGHWLWGSTVDFQTGQLEFVSGLLEKYGHVARFSVAFHEWVQVSDPEAVHEILVKRPELFLKPKVNKQIFKLFLGEGVLSADGDAWKRQHKMILPAFHKRRIDAYGEVMTHFTDQMIDAWKEGERVDFCHEMTELTLGIVAKTLFDADVRGSQAETVREAMKVINQVLVDHIELPIPVPGWWPSRKNRRKMAAIGDIDRIVQRIIDERRRTGEDRGDLLSMLIQARDEAGEGMGDKQVRDESMTLFFAGHETTAHALTWCWYLLGQHPEVVVKMQEEVARVCGDRKPTIDDNLGYIDQVFKEAMRVLPSVWTFMREPAEDVLIGDYLLPKGCYVFISPFVMHKNPEYFPEPEVFRPERFTKEFERNLPKAAYVPFSMGPRVCMGKNFALMEARLILATLIQRGVEPRIPADYTPIKNPRLSLNPKNGLPNVVHFKPPSGAQAQVGESRANP